YYYFPGLDLYATDFYDLHKTQHKVLDLKAGKASTRMISSRAKELKGIFDDIIPHKKAVVVPLPCHTVGKISSLEPVVKKIEEQSSNKYINGTNFIFSREETDKGSIVNGRERFSPDIHADSMGVNTHSENLKLLNRYPVILLDDVYATGETMRGAEILLKNFTKSKIFKVAILKAG
ncbi:MAG: hypothetical protein ACP5JP_10895, partial [bacterium]